MSLLDWIKKLCLELSIAREIYVSPEKILFIHEYLVEREFEDWRRYVAEKWILFGNWQYKKTLELSDFYPNEKQWKEIGSAEFIPLEEFNREISNLKMIYQQKLNFAIEQMKYSEKRSTNSKNDELIEKLAEMTFKISDLNEKLNEKAMKRVIYGGNNE